MNPLDENFILKTLLDYINPFSENFILKDVLSFLGDMLSYVNPFSENFFGYKIIDMFSDLFYKLFIPKEETLLRFKNVLDDKFSFVDSIKTGVNSLVGALDNMGQAPSISVELAATKYTEKQKVKIIDLSWYSPYKTYGDIIITAIAYIFFLWRMFIKLPSILSGVGGQVQEEPFSFFRDD